METTNLGGTFMYGGPLVPLTFSDLVSAAFNFWFLQLFNLE